MLASETRHKSRSRSARYQAEGTHHQADRGGVWDEFLFYDSIPHSHCMDAAFYPQHQITDQDQEEVARFYGDPTGPQSSLPPLSEVVFPQRAQDTGEGAGVAETELHPTSPSLSGQGRPLTSWRTFGQH